MSDAAAQARWALALVDALEAAGVRQAFISPGSRSTPLVWALGETGIARAVVIDERAAAFAALGAASATDTPALLVCTSGSAGAHYMPAVVEAKQAGVPLVVCTADRPPELHANGSSQTMDQTRLFGSFAPTFELGAPTGHAEHLNCVLRVAHQAVDRARRSRGPVHINAPFRKPLEPPADFDVEAARATRRPPMRARAGATEALSPDVAADLLGPFANAERPVVIAGPMAARCADAARDASRLAAALGAPLWAEASSQWSSAGDTGFDAYLQPPRALAPDAVLQLGPTPVSAAFDRWLQAEPPEVYATVSDVGSPNARNVATDLLHVSDLPSAVAVLADAAEGMTDNRPAARGSWLDACARAHEGRRAALDAWLSGKQLTGVSAARAVAEAAPEGSTLLVGNSLCVRDLDEASPALAPGVRVQSHRGTAGIDGWFAASVGTARATERPTLAFIGDVAAVHDLSSLTLARDVRAPLVLCVLDNGGGRIFERLPVASHPALGDRLEAEWLTPPEVDFVAVAQALGVNAARVASVADLRLALTIALTRPGPTLLHAIVDPAHDAESRAALRDAVRASLALLPSASS